LLSALDSPPFESLTQQRQDHTSLEECEVLSQAVARALDEGDEHVRSHGLIELVVLATRHEAVRAEDGRFVVQVMSPLHESSKSLT
jgi:hypothetical protein